MSPKIRSSSATSRNKPRYNLRSGASSSAAENDAKTTEVAHRALPPVSTSLSVGFQLFCKLPTELRDMIWTNLLLPRLFHAALLRDTFSSDPDDNEGDEEIDCDVSLVSTSPTPIIFHINQESRMVALKHYKLFIDSSESHYFIPSLDTLVLGDCDFWLDGDAVMALEPEQLAIVDTVQHLVVPDFYFKRRFSRDLLKVINDLPTHSGPTHDEIIDRTVMGHFGGLKSIRMEIKDGLQLDRHEDSVRRIKEVVVPFMAIVTELNDREPNLKLVVEICSADAEDDTDDTSSVIG